MLVIKGSEFTPAPEGVHAACCIDVVDLGMVDGPWGAKHKIKLVWEIGALMEDGKRFLVSKWYTASLHEKSTLAKDLKSWRGRPFTADELKGFDIEKVIGVPCQLVISHDEKDGTVYGNVQTVIKPQGEKLVPSGGYIRVKDRPENQLRNGKPANAGSGTPSGEDEIPF